MKIVLLVLLFEFTFAMNGQNIVFDRDVHVLRLHARKLGFKDDLVLILVYVHAWAHAPLVNSLSPPRLKPELNALFISSCRPRSSRNGSYVTKFIIIFLL